jgi:hypothetical protein
MGPGLRRDDENNFLNLKIPIDNFLWDDILNYVLPDEGPLLEAVLISGRSESWPDRGAPERLTGWWQVERREALRPTSLGARGSPCRARWVR